MAPSAGITITFPFVCFVVWLSASLCLHSRGRKKLWFSPSITLVHYMYMYLHVSTTPAPHFKWIFICCLYHSVVYGKGRYQQFIVINQPFTISQLRCAISSIICLNLKLFFRFNKLIPSN